MGYIKYVKADWRSRDKNRLQENATQSFWRPAFVCNQRFLCFQPLNGRTERISVICLAFLFLRTRVLAEKHKRPTGFSGGILDMPSVWCGRWKNSRGTDLSEIFLLLVSTRIALYILGYNIDNQNYSTKVAFLFFKIFCAKVSTILHAFELIIKELIPF